MSGEPGPDQVAAPSGLSSVVGRFIYQTSRPSLLCATLTARSLADNNQFLILIIRPVSATKPDVSLGNKQPMG